MKNLKESRGRHSFALARQIIKEALAARSAIGGMRRFNIAGGSSMLACCSLAVSSVAIIQQVYAAPATLVQAVTHNSETVTMRLTKENLRGANFELWAQNATGGYDVITPVLERSYIGTVDEYPDAVSCGVLQDDGTFHGAIYFDRGVTWRTLGSAVEGTQALHYAPDQFTSYNLPSAPTVSAGQGGSTTYGFDIGIDAEYTYYDVPGNNSVAKTYELIEYSICLVRAQYLRDALLRPYLGRVIIRTDQAQDPYAGLGGGTYLDAVRNHWNSNHTDANSDLVAGVSLWSVGGGLAWVGVVGTSSGYSVNDSGTSGAFDVIFRHEMGHNWNCGHYVGGSPEGTGFMGGNGTGRFSSCEVHRVMDHRDAKAASGVVDSEGTYTSVELPPYASLDVATFTQSVDSSITVNVLANDHDANGQTLSLSSFDSTSFKGGTITQQGQDLVYTAQGSYLGTDHFNYVVTDTAGKTATGVVVVDVKANDNLKLYLALDETTGTTAEEASIHGNTGTISGTDLATASVAGQFGNAIDLDGVDDHVSVSGIPSNSDTVTITGWIKQDAVQASMAGLVYTRDYAASGLHMGTAKELRYTWNEQEWDWDSGLVPPDDTWTFVALVIEPSQATMYMNHGTGFQSAVNVASHTAANLSGATYVGWDSLDEARHFNGTIDDVRIYDYSMSQVDLQKIYDGGAAESPSPFDGASELEYGSLSWAPSSAATSYEVYVGTDQTAVSNATTASPEYQGSTTSTNSYVSNLQASATYYWRVDSVTAGGTIPGTVWIFDTAGTLGDFSSGLLTHLTMDDADISGATINDVSGAAQGDGTITGATSGHLGQIGEALDFNGGSDKVDIPAAAFASLNDQISISVWIYGDDTQARDDGLLYAVDSSGNRVLTIHAPWSNSEVYWDAGHDGAGAYDRINKAAASADFKGQWNHWVFTKNTTSGEMQVYLNGSLWNSAGGKTLTMNGISTIVLGQDSSGLAYDGKVDDLAVWNRELTSEAIRAIYLKGLDGSTFTPQINTAPVAGDLAFAIAEDTAVATSVGTVLATDVDAGDTLSYAIISGNDGGEFAINSSTGEITTATSFDFEVTTQYVLTVTVSDDGTPVLSDTATITVNVTDVNEAPTANDNSGTLAENAAIGSAVATVTTSDPDAGDSVSFAITGGNTGNAFAIDASGNITTATALDFETTPSYSLTVTATDGGGLSDTAIVTATITDVAEGPVDSDGDGVLDAVEIALGTDPNLASSTPGSHYAGLVGWWDLDEASGTAAADASGYAHDGTVTAATVVAGVDGNARDFSGSSQHVNLGNAASMDVVGVITMAAWVKPDATNDFRNILAHGYATSPDGEVMLRIYNGAYQVGSWNGTNVMVSAGDANADVGNWVHIAGIYDGTHWRLYRNGVELANVASAQGAVSVSDNWAIGARGNGTERFFDGAIDDARLYDRALSAVEVTALHDELANHAPVATDASFGVAEDALVSAVVGTVSATDPDAGDTLSYAITAGNAGSEFAINSSTGEITTAAAFDFENFSQYVFTVTVSDDATPALSDTATVTVNVTDVNEAPVANDNSGSVSEDAVVGTAVATVSASDVDAGDSLTYAITAGNSGNAFAIDNSGNITTAAGLDFETTASYTLTVEVTDSGSLTDAAAVTVTVTDVVETTAPVVATGSASNIAMSTADLGYSITDDGGEAPSVTLYYGTTDGGTTSGNWASSVAVGAKATGAYVESLTGLTEGTSYYFTIAATNSVATTWGSTGSFATTADTSPKMVRTTVNSVSSTNWTTVDLGQNYTSAVIVATPIYADSTQVPVVTRIRNVSGSSFDLKLDRADGLTADVTCNVSVIAVEEGVYTLATDGVQMEAVKFTSTITAENNSWNAEARTYQNSYTTPVVVGQVMSANDANWSTFWSMGSSRLNPADASNLNVGKHVGEDPNVTRANETIGYIVIESGNGTINGVAYTAAVGSDIVRNYENSASGYSYSLTGLSSASAAALSSTAMDGTDGAWPVLNGVDALSASTVKLIVDEDQLKDSEQKHATEQINYIIFE